MPEESWTPPAKPAEKVALETVYFPSKLKKEVSYRLSSIEATIRALTKNGELSDYDDEMHNDLHEAVRYLRALVDANGWTPESFTRGVDSTPNT